MIPKIIQMPEEEAEDIHIVMAEFIEQGILNVTQTRRIVSAIRPVYEEYEKLKSMEKKEIKQPEKKQVMRPKKNEILKGSQSPATVKNVPKKA